MPLSILLSEYGKIAQICIPASISHTPRIAATIITDVCQENGVSSNIPPYHEMLDSRRVGRRTGDADTVRRMPFGPVIQHTKAHRRKAVKGGPVHLEESCEEFKRASWEVQKKYHFALPRIKGIEKLMEGAGFMIVVSRRIRGMIYTVTGEK